MEAVGWGWEIDPGDYWKRSAPRVGGSGHGERDRKE